MTTPLGTEDTAVVQTPEQIAANLAGRVANPSASDLAAAAAKQKAEAAKVDPEQAKIDAENEAKKLVKAGEQTPEEKAKSDQEAKDKLEKNDDGSWKKEFIDAGSEAGNATITLLKAAGVSPVEANSIFEKALASGDLKDVNWAVLEARLTPEQYVLAKAGIEKHYEGHYQVQKATQDYGYKVVGGEANWLKVKEWANAKEKVDPAFAAEVDGVRKAIGIGGYAAQIAIDALAAKYNADPKNTTITPEKMERGQSLPNNAVSGEPLTRRQFYEARAKLGDRATKEQTDALWARRQAGAAKGI